MERFGEMIRRLREAKGEPLRVLAAYLKVDQAVMSKIERGHRKPTRNQVEKLAKYFKADKQEMLIAWLSDRIVYEVEGESIAREALKVAEMKIAYGKPKLLTRKSTVKRICHFLERDGRIKRAWIFGSFVRGEDGPISDIDIMVEEYDSAKFSYFDLADIQYQLQKLLNRKVDLGFIGSLKEPASGQIWSEAVLIYAK